MNAPHGVIHVVAGILQDPSGRKLIAQRPAGRHLAGGWEFPGGKLLPGESRIDGLRRELLEELGIRLTAARPLIQVRHAYPDRSILLDVWLVNAHEGSPCGLDGQRLRWCGVNELPHAQLLAADRPVVAALRLPERLVRVSTAVYEVADPASFSQPEMAGKLCGAWCRGAGDALASQAAGADFLVLRHLLSAADLVSLCESVNVPVFAQGIGLEEAWELGATGIYAA